MFSAFTTQYIVHRVMSDLKNEMNPKIIEARSKSIRSSHENSTLENEESIFKREEESQKNLSFFEGDTKPVPGISKKSTGGLFYWKLLLDLWK
jgi:hypothetical protein